jgi:hypothetical protein
MKSIITGLLIAIVFFAGAAVARTQARNAEDLADAHFRLATLQHRGADALQKDTDEDAPSWWQISPWRNEERRHRGTVTYWLGQYEGLTPLLETKGVREVKDPVLLFAAANAAFRESDFENIDRKTAVDRLDAVIQAYATLLRLDPTHADAAYNYEFVSRVRDALARNRPRANLVKESADEASPDLPAGATVHGRPGAPPVTIKGDEFKTLTPMRYDEREETAPGPGAVKRRRG